MMKASKLGCVLLLSNAYMVASESLIRREEPSSRSLAVKELNVPTLGDAWKSIPDFPPDELKKEIGEASAAMVGNDLVITGGFERGWNSGSEETFSFDLKAYYEGQAVDWVQHDKYPITPFVSHIGHAVKGNLFYNCGGYLGKDPGPGKEPGPDIADCFVFDKEKEPEMQWTRIPSLPDGRGGGAMVYVEAMDSLVFALGSQRRFVNGTYDDTEDFDDTWMLNLTDVAAGWVSMAPVPYKANHVSAVVANDCWGNPHYFFLGGQILEREQDGNLDDVYEFFPATNEWVKRASIPQGTGHVSSATVPYGCGFIIVGGSIDGSNLSIKSKTSDLYYYDIPTDTWTKIGEYVQKVKTPACASYADKLYCASGYLRGAYEIDISYPLELPLPEVSATPTASAVPSAQPSAGPTNAPTTTPLWDSYNILTKVTSGDFCPGASVLVRVQVGDDAPAGVPVTLKSDALGIDLSGVTANYGKGEFEVALASSDVKGTFEIEGCAYDAGGKAYCHTREVELSCGPLWDDALVKTIVKKDSDFCPDANMVVRLQVAGDAVQGALVTLKSEELGIDLSKKTNKRGRARFPVFLDNPSQFSGRYAIEGCAYDANGFSYCHTRKVTLSCQTDEPTLAPIEEASSAPTQGPTAIE